MLDRGYADFREFFFSALGHIGQTVNATRFAYATRCALQTGVGRHTERVYYPLDTYQFQLPSPILNQQGTEV